MERAGAGGGAMVTFGSAGECPATAVAGGWRLDSVRGHGSGSHVEPEATTRPLDRQT